VVHVVNEPSIWRQWNFLFSLFSFYLIFAHGTSIFKGNPSIVFSFRSGLCYFYYYLFYFKQFIKKKNSISSSFNFFLYQIWSSFFYYYLFYLIFKIEMFLWFHPPYFFPIKIDLHVWLLFFFLDKFFWIDISIMVSSLNIKFIGDWVS
jgi:hypothetical protein